MNDSELWIEISLGAMRSQNVKNEEKYQSSGTYTHHTHTHVHTFPTSIAYTLHVGWCCSNRHLNIFWNTTTTDDESTHQFPSTRLLLLLLPLLPAMHLDTSRISRWRYFSCYFFLVELCSACVHDPPHLTIISNRIILIVFEWRKATSVERINEFFAVALGITRLNLICVAVI